MANIAGAYDPNAEAQTGYDPLPAGEYTAKIIDSDIEDVSKHSDKGRCLKLTWQIEGGEFDGRLVWQRLNMWGENMGPNTGKVVEIAMSQFSAIRQATGKIHVQDSEELHHIPCAIRLALKTDPSGQYPPQNEVKSVKAASGHASANAGSAPSQASAPGGGGGSAPWRKPAA